jgi:hypothetical protein
MLSLSSSSMGRQLTTTSSYMYSPWMPHAPSENAPSDDLWGEKNSPTTTRF